MLKSKRNKHLRCIIGFHKWHIVVPATEVGQYRKCELCDKKQYRFWRLWGDVMGGYWDWSYWKTVK